MRRNTFLISIMMAAGCIAPAAAASFGTVVPIVGSASDIALDETRGRLYIANFTSNRIDVLSTSDNTVHSSINLLKVPSSITLSPDGHFLLVTNYGPNAVNGTTITLIDLTSNAQQNFSTGNPPLGVAFFSTGSGQMALVVTTTAIDLFDPIAGTLQQLAAFSNLAMTLPVPATTFPGQIVETALATSADHMHVWGVASAIATQTVPQLIFKFDGATGLLTADGWITSPLLLPRVSVASDGSWAMIGWSAFAPALCNPGPNFMIRSRYPEAVPATNITGHAIDSANNILYAQIPDPNQPTGPPYTAAKPPTLAIMDADNLTVRDRLILPESMTGRAVLNAAATILYSVSDSGVMVLPVGSLNQSHRLTASTEDLFVQSSFCTRSAVQQTFNITDPGNNSTDFAISVSQSGVTVSPMYGTTPATIIVTVNPSAVASTSGTLAVPIQISSASAVDLPPSVRLLISSPDLDQRGAVVDVPGTLTDILADPSRNRFYVLRQDKNEVLVFDGNTNTQITALRTGTNPTYMSLNWNDTALIIANSDSQLLYQYDLDTLQEMRPMMLPASHYGRSVAQSNGSTLVLIENDTTQDCIGSAGASVACAIDKIDYISGCAYRLPTLGVFANDNTIFPATSVLAPTPGGSGILAASPSGNVMLYNAQTDSFVTSRQDFKSLSGAYAASDSGGYVIGDNVFNSSLVPIGTFDTSVGNTMGFAFTGQGTAGYRVTGSISSGPGVIQDLPAALPGVDVNPVRVTEAPRFSSTTTPFVRTVAPMGNDIAVLTTSGVTVLPSGYNTPVVPPSVSAVVSAADGSSAVAPGGLISIYGSSMAATNMATSTIPLPTALAQSCLVINGNLTPLIFVSPSQINAQLPSRVDGTATLTIHTPGGVSGDFYFNVNSTAPSVFQSGTAGPVTGLATIVRADDGQLITPTNPVHSGDTLVIYLTGLGATAPAVQDGMAPPNGTLASAILTPMVTLGGDSLGVLYAGLVPGLVGVYQINAEVPLHAPQGLTVPLVITQGVESTTVAVRVVN
jgi:uncharacterized protein (TIGR03437 family)